MHVDTGDTTLSNTDYEAELLGTETCTEALIDMLNESLLCTPSSGVLDTEPMPIHGAIHELIKW